MYPKIHLQVLSLRFLFYLSVLYFLSVFLTSNKSCIGIALVANASCIANDDFNDFRSVLIFSNNSVVDVDVHVDVNINNYLNSKFYDHDFQSKPESNSKNFKLEILFSVFSLFFYYIFLKHNRELRFQFTVITLR